MRFQWVLLRGVGMSFIKERYKHKNVRKHRNRKLGKKCIETFENAEDQIVDEDEVVALLAALNSMSSEIRRLNDTLERGFEDLGDLIESLEDD